MTRHFATRIHTDNYYTDNVRHMTMMSRVCEMLILVLGHWACRWWVNHQMLRIASATPSDLYLPSQPHSITALWPVSNYSAWWQRHMCVNDLLSGDHPPKANDAYSPSLPTPSSLPHPSPPLLSLRSRHPLIQLGGLREHCKLPQRVRAEGGRQTIFGAFWAEKCFWWEQSFHEWRKICLSLVCLQAISLNILIYC